MKGSYFLPIAIESNRIWLYCLWELSFDLEGGLSAEHMGWQDPPLVRSSWEIHRLTSCVEIRIVDEQDGKSTRVKGMILRLYYFAYEWKYTCVKHLVDHECEVALRVITSEKKWNDAE